MSRDIVSVCAISLFHRWRFLLTLCIFAGVFGCSNSYGPAELMSGHGHGPYGVYIIQKAGAQPEALRAVGDDFNPTGMHGKYKVPKCYRWGILNLDDDFDVLVSDMNKSGVPELLVLTPASPDMQPSREPTQVALLKLKNLKSLKRLDLRYFLTLDPEVIKALCGIPHLEELYLPQWVTLRGDIIASIPNLQAQYSSLKIKIAKEYFEKQALLEGRGNVARTR